MRGPLVLESLVTECTARLRVPFFLSELWALLPLIVLSPSTSYKVFLLVFFLLSLAGLRRR